MINFDAHDLIIHNMKKDKKVLKFNKFKIAGFNMRTLRGGSNLEATIGECTINTGPAGGQQNEDDSEWCTLGQPKTDINNPCGDNATRQNACNGQISG